MFPDRKNPPEQIPGLEHLNGSESSALTKIAAPFRGVTRTQLNKYEDDLLAIGPNGEGIIAGGQSIADLRTRVEQIKGPEFPFRGIPRFTFEQIQEMLPE